MHFETWPNLIDAAKQLNMSVRTVQRHIAAGRIEASKRQVPGRSPETICNPADIDRMRPTAFLMPVSPGRKQGQMELSKPQPTTPPPLTANAMIDALTTLATIATSAAPRQEPPIERPWLTLIEAAGCSGLSRHFLRHLIQTGEITSVRDGRTWKISRASLQAWKPSKSSPLQKSASSP